MKHRTFFFLGIMAVWFLTSVNGNRAYTSEPFEHVEQVVDQVHRRSLRRRREIRKNVLSSDRLWPYDNWGNLMWCLVALYQNSRVKEANERLFQLFHDRTLERKPGLYHQDRVRILTLFNRYNGKYPGRLKGKAEEALTETLWNWVRSYSKVKYADPDEDGLWITHGTENHDLQFKLAYYFLSHVFKDHPDYKHRTYDDGHTPEQHFHAWNRYWKTWLKERATKGLWIELGSSTYRKYSYAAIFNLYDLSPDPDVRKRAKMFLDLAFIEEAQISFRDGLRGGGQSRVGKRRTRKKNDTTPYVLNGFSKIKNLLYGEGGKSTHSKNVETSSYQLPPEAIALRKRAFNEPFDPFVIANRVPGELANSRNEDLLPSKWGHHLSPTSSLVNYTYRTPHYMLGCTLQKPTERYAAISHQNRWSGILFAGQNGNHPTVHPYPVPARPNNNRTHDAYWNVQHKNVMIVQKLDRKTTKYIDNRGVMFYFSPELERTEQQGWVFATDGNAYVALRPVYGGYRWNENEDWGDTMLILEQKDTPVLFHAGGPADGFSTFQEFKTHVLNSDVGKTQNMFSYQPPGSARISFFTDDRPPRVNGKQRTFNQAYNSPFLNGSYGGDEVRVTVGPYKTVYDFAHNEIRRSK